MTNVINTEDYPDYEKLRQRVLALEQRDREHTAMIAELNDRIGALADRIGALELAPVLAEVWRSEPGPVYEIVPDEQGYRLEPAQRARMKERFEANVAAFIPRRFGTTDPAQLGGEPDALPELPPIVRLRANPPVSREEGEE